MRLRPAGGKGGNRTVPLECAENFCCIYTWSLHAGQGHGELSHAGRTRQCEQSCGLGVGLGAASWRRRGGCNHGHEWLIRGNGRFLKIPVGKDVTEKSQL